MSFGGWLRLKRKESRLTQGELADKVGISTSYVSTLERSQPHGLTNAPPQPAKHVVISLAKALNTDLDEALLAAGYAPISEGNSLSLEVGEGVEIRFQDFVPEEEREEVRKAVRRIVAGIRAEQEKDRSASEE